MSLFAELKRRNVIRVAVAYLVAAWVVIEAGALFLDIFAAPDWVIRVITILLAVGFPVVLLFAWAFEVTPEGIKRERDVERSASLTHRTARRLDLLTIAMVIVGAGLLLTDRLLPEPGAGPAVSPGAVGLREREGASQAVKATAAPVIAVLPFKAIGSEDGGFLAGGLHDDLLTRLAKLGAFRVISRTSMMEYADTTKNMRRIGEELGAGYILEGGVQAMGDRVRINAQLIDAPADEHIWAEVYNRELTASNLFDVQAELARAIATALQTELSSSDLALVNEVPTDNLPAYNAYLSGLKLFEPTGYVGTLRDRQAVEALEEAVRLDPDFALAWATLATARIRASCCDYTTDEAEAALAALARARALQAGMIESELAWAEYLYRVMKEYGQALDTLKAQGERIEGHVYALQLKGWLHRRLGQVEESYASVRAALALNPRSLSLHIDLTSRAWAADDCEAAARSADRLLALAPEAPEARVRAAEYELQCTGNAERAVDLIRDVDFTTTGGFEAALWAAWKSRDAQLAHRLLDSTPMDPDWDVPVWQELGRVRIYRYLESDPAAAEAAIERAAERLEEAIEEAPERKESADYANLMFTFAADRGDADETRRWVDEHKRRIQEQFKGDVALEAQGHLFYASAYAVVGLPDEAVAELRAMLRSPWGHRFPVVDGAPEFDALQAHPGFLALKAQYGRSQ